MLPALRHTVKSLLSIVFFAFWGCAAVESNPKGSAIKDQFILKNGLHTSSKKYIELIENDSQDSKSSAKDNYILYKSDGSGCVDWYSVYEECDESGCSYKFKPTGGQCH